MPPHYINTVPIYVKQDIINRHPHQHRRLDALLPLHQ